MLTDKQRHVEISKWPGVLSILFLLAAVLGRWPYGAYMLMRVVVCFSAAYIAVTAHKLNRPAWAWIMVAVAVSFNPVLPFRMHRSDWRILDLIVVAAFAGSFLLCRDGD